MAVYTHGTTRVVLPRGTAITAALPGEDPVDISDYVAPLLDAALRQRPVEPVGEPDDLLDGVDVRLECPADAVITHEGAPVDGQLALVIIGRVVTTSLLTAARERESGSAD